VLDDKKIKIRREVAGGDQEVYEVDLPCVLSIQTGINEPRYVPIRGVMKAAGIEIPVHGASDLRLSRDSVGESGVRVKRRAYFLPEGGEGAEILEGRTEEIMEKLIALLKSKGRIR
jgi:electron transfer flavoprotein beta subunit